jgi:NADP-dependent 3-hydroxy acid dehydrogenase YdfG
MGRLTGKGVLVTGGGSGIGLASARLLLDEGAKVAIAGRNASKLNEAAAALNAGDRLSVHAADLADADQAARLVGEATGQLGAIDILVNNAGMNVKDRQLAQLTPDGWRQLVAGNLDNAFYCLLAVLPQMRQRGGGLVIVVNSISGLRANPLGGIGYIAAKFGLRGLAMGAAAEEKPNNIRVTSIYPGEVNTPILAHRPESVSEERKRAMLQPEDVGQAVRFVATLPDHVAIPELIITPANATYV